MKLPVLTMAAFLASSTFLSAQTFTEKVIDKLQEQGFEITEVDHGNGLIKVESVRNGKVRELVYDSQTGKLLKDEYDGEDQTDDGEDDDHDGVSTHDDSDDDSDDDSSDDGEDDDSGDDDSSDDGEDDDSGDDDSSDDD